MSGEQIDQLLRDADPYRRPEGEAVKAAAGELLEQIVAEPVGSRRSFGLVVAGVAAAVVAVAVVVVPATRHGDPDAPATPVSTPVSSPAVPSPSAPPSTPPPTPSSMPLVSGVLDPERIVLAAQDSPRLTPGEPGWKVIHLEPFGVRQGEMTYEKGGRRLEVTWYPETDYSQRRTDRWPSSRKVSVGGLTGYLLVPSKGTFTVATEPRDGVMAVLNGGKGFTGATARAFLTTMRRVDAGTWAATTAAQTDREGEAGTRVARLLSEDMPPPPDWNAWTSAKELPSGSTLELDDALVKRVTCGWLIEWQRAKATGDGAALTRANQALLSSAGWRTLQALEGRTATPQLIRKIADAVPSGRASAAEVQAYRASVC
ncbi:hypothetical protein [Actinoplanes sp. URMC 104]|uniref:hypothetical protein n=1 Tax=Actinoplanes sp. URMC 104 TaxID=3423409 RepID=UPI003F19EFBD